MKCSLLVLSSYLDGELEARREGELEAHMVGCQRCRAGLGYLREEVERIGALGRVHVADHSVHSLLSQLGLIDADDELPAAAVGIALADAPETAWMGGGDDPTTVPWPGARALEPSVDMTGTAAREPAPPAPAAHAPAPEAKPWFRWLPAAEEPPGPTPETAPPTEYEPPSLPSQSSPPFTWSPPAPPTPAAMVPDDGVPHSPPPTAFASDDAPSAPTSGGAFPPGGPERVDPSDSPAHDSASGGEPEMTASPPWSPHQAATGPLYPMTDDDVLGAPQPVERFGPPPQAARPRLLERLRDRVAVRRALSRSSSAYEDQVQIVSGLGAPLRPGRARLEVERRRQETLHMDPGAVPVGAGAIAAHADDTFGDAGDDDADELGLGPLPPPLPPVTPMPRPPSRPGQMSLPGTSVGDPFNPSSTDPRAPIHRVPMPPPRHTLGSVLGDIETPPPPPATPPPPDPLSEALSDYDREPGTAAYQPRPWRPREIAEDSAVAAGAPARRFGTPPETAKRRLPGPSQLREGRRLLAIFGAATLLMFVVGVVSGRTTSPLPTSSSAPIANPPAPAKAPRTSTQSSHSASSSTATAPSIAPSAQPAPSLTGTPQLTGAKDLGDTGTGYQVKDFRYGIHPGDFRIVLDLDASGTASGTPKATIGFFDPTTLYVVLTGVVPAGSTGQLPSSNPVSGVTLMDPSPFPGAITYQIKLAHPLTFSAGYVTGPLRLVLDLAS